MGPLLALLLIVLLSLLAVQLATNALVLTGMSLHSARFQAASAFFGTGFTTREAELVVTHPVRRRIILHLIIGGNIGLTSAVATLIVTFVQRTQESLVSNLLMIGVLIGGAIFLAVLFNLPVVTKPVDFLMRKTLESAGVHRAVDYEVLLNVRQGYYVSDVEVAEGHPMAGKSLAVSRPSDQGIVVLGIHHASGSFQGAPDKTAVVNAGDTIMVYGSEEAVNALVAAGPDREPA